MPDFRIELMRVALRCLAVAGAIATTACATGSRVTPKVDLQPAREAVARAREIGADQSAPEAYRRAEDHLEKAESWSGAGSGDAQARAREADAFARLALAEAECALEIAQRSLARDASVATGGANAGKIESLTSRARKAEEAQRRLEERVAFLSRELELTENEVIRTKARLKGNETKAEASSAIAEARILARRLASERPRSASVPRCNELIAKAEQLLQQENFGAAAFFALKAQDIAVKSEEISAAPEASGGKPEGSPEKSSYVVRVAVARIRRGPDAKEPVVGTAPKGATLAASLVRGEWIKVTYRSATGWIHRSLVD